MTPEEIVEYEVMIMAMSQEQFEHHLRTSPYATQDCREFARQCGLNV